MAYAALVSLIHILDQIQHPSPHPLLVNEHHIEFESLHENISFLLDFLEDNSQKRFKEPEDLQSLIRDTAYAAEDIIESDIVRHIYADSDSKKEHISAVFCQHMHRVTESMDLIKNEVAKVKELIDELPKNPAVAASSRCTRGESDTSIVAFNDDLVRIMDVLTSHETNLNVIPIVGMGGIGKTTLAKDVYDNLLIMEHFYVRAWITISQEYKVREILLGLLHDSRVLGSEVKLESLADEMSKKSDEAIGEVLYKSLCGRRYLIVMDDLWSMAAWDKIKTFFPDYRNGSRILVTTRELNVAMQIGNKSAYKMKELDLNQSWKLLCKRVFAEEGCSSELEKIGKEIARNCGGLPLAIDTIASLLAKSEKTREYWEYVVKDLNSIINLRNDERFLNVLSLSYDYLPVHLKPCFLYVGVFPEKKHIRVSQLIRLWVAEGFLKRIHGKSMEEVAEDYLQDLIDRHLVVVRQRGTNGKPKTCSMHDLLRDLCIREACKEKFMCVARLFSLDILEGMANERRLSLQESAWENKYRPRVVHMLQSASLARSLIYNCVGDCSYLTTNFRLLRVLDTVDTHSMKDIARLVNLRYLCFTVNWDISSRFPSSFAKFWNLETLIVRIFTSKPVILPSEIWEMRKLRHLRFNGYLPDPPASVVLENLQILKGIKNIRCTDKFLRALPNLAKLAIVCEDKKRGYCLNNLVRLHKLQSLNCIASSKISAGEIAFPRSLKKLCLSGLELPWEAMTIIGLLPNLEVLKLRRNAFTGPVWEPTEGEFCRLKFLQLSSDKLQHWRGDTTHFPLLESLMIHDCMKLEEIPSGIGDIPTLELIDLKVCKPSAVASAEEILKEQRSLGNDVLQVRSSHT